MVGVVVKYAPGLESSRGLGACPVRSWFRVKSGPGCVVWFLLVVAFPWCWCSVLSGTIQGPKSWLVQRLRPPNPSPAPNIVLNRYQMCWQHCTKPGTPSRPIPVPRRDQFRYTVATNSGTNFGSIPVSVLDQFWYQFWSKSGTSFGPILVPVLDQIWFKIGPKSGSKSVPNLVQGRQSSRPNGAHLHSKWSTPSTFFDRFCTHQNRHMPGRASKRSFYIRPTTPKWITFGNAKNHQFEMARTCLQNGSHLLFNVVHTCFSKRSCLPLKVGRKSSRWAASIPQGGPQAYLKVCRKSS